jgi:signal transduction histidine kinase
MNIKNENQLLFVIRYGLLILILLLSIIITTFLYYESKSTFEEIKKSTEEKLITNKKHIIQEQVDNTYDYIFSEQNDTEIQLKESLKLKLYETHKLITDIHNQYKDIYSKEEIKNIIKTVIKDIRFNNGRGYFFVYDKAGKNIIHSLLPELEGKNLINHQDITDNFVLKERLALLKDNDEAYQEWYWRKSKTDSMEYKKIGFLKNIYELDWLIGTGEYVDDFEADIQEKVLKQINKLRFGSSGYYFILDVNNIYLTTHRASAIGKNVFKENNLNNTETVIKNMWDKAKNGGGFIEYVQKTNPIINKPREKNSYVRLIPKWNWLLGTGFYKDDIRTQIEKEEEILIKRYEENLKSFFIVSIISTLILAGLSFYISIIIEQKFKNYKKSIQLYVEENQKQYELLSQKSKLAAMGEMLENIAHQWRQPLSLVSVAASGIKINKELNILSDKFLMEALDCIENGTKHLNETIEDFRDFFSSEKEKKFFYLEDALKKVDKLLSLHLDKMGINVIKNIKNIKINNYERELLQVLLNILKNAMDALEKVDGEKYIFIDIFEKENNLYIQIKDNAGGIDESIIDRIFEPYFTTKHKSQGTGIGLYMSTEIITKHMNGKLKVENSSYEHNNKTFTGAMFTIEL